MLATLDDSIAFALPGPALSGATIGGIDPAKATNPHLTPLSDGLLNLPNGLPIDLWLAELGEDEGPASSRSVQGIGPVPPDPISCTARDGLPWPVDDPNGTQGCVYEDALFSQRAVQVIDRFADAQDAGSAQPLFLFYAPHIVHEPLQAR